MEELREKTRKFLKKNKSPGEEDVQEFLDKIISEHPSIEIDDFKQKLEILIEQDNLLDLYNKELSHINKELPYYKEVEVILQEAKINSEKLEDVSAELKTANNILTTGKKDSKKIKDEKITGKAIPDKKPEVEVPESIGEEKTANKGKTSKKGKKHKSKNKGPQGGVEDLLSRLDDDFSSTRDFIKDQMTPEKEAVLELFENKLISDVETRIKKLKTLHEEALVLKKPTSLSGKIKNFFTVENAEKETYDPAIHGPLVTFDGIDGFQELERYWVNEPYCFVVILINTDTNDRLYYAVEPDLSGFEDILLMEIKDRLKDILLVEDIKSDEDKDKDKILTAKVNNIINDYGIEIEPTTLEKILYYTRRDFIYLDKIDPLIHDDRIEDISSNGHNIPIYLYHKKYTNIPTNIVFSEDEVNSFVIRLAQRCGKHISVAEPLIDATMPDGSRIQMTLGKEVTSHGATFTIRKFNDVPITPIDLINWNTFSVEAMAYLWLCIENNKSLIFAGGTASGKTSSLNAVALFIPQLAKIVSLEDTRELKLPHPNWIPGITRDSFTPDGRGSIDMYELLKAALRQRPEYLLVGEVRGKEALTLFQAMSTGHTTFSTMHADSVASAIHRLENPPISVPRTMIQALDIISIQSQTYIMDKRVRRNMKLVEITDIDPTTRNIRTNDIFSWDALTDTFVRVGESKAINDVMKRRGWSIQELKRDLNYRQQILQLMVDNKITDFNAIFTIIHDYHSTPEKIIKQLNLKE